MNSFTEQINASQVFRLNLECMARGQVRQGNIMSYGRAQALFGQTIHEYKWSTKVKLSAIRRLGFFTNTEEARNKGYFKKRNPRSTLPCPL